MARTKDSSGDVTGPRMRDAATRLFARHGYAAVSMRQIAAEIGLQAGALYRYTPDKQSLLFDLMQAHLTELLDAVALQDWPDDPVAALDAFTRHHIRFHHSRPDAVFVAYMELRNLTPDNFARIEALRRRYEAHLRAILQRGQARGIFALPDIPVASYAIIAMLTGVTTWYRTGGRLSLTQIETLYCDMVRKSVIA